MYTEILRSIVGIEIYPVLSLTLFVSLFGGVLVWALSADRTRLDELAALPFDDARPDAEVDSVQGLSHSATPDAVGPTSAPIAARGCRRSR
jgi:hypothetical protein